MSTIFTAANSSVTPHNKQYREEIEKKSTRNLTGEGKTENASPPPSEPTIFTTSHHPLCHVRRCDKPPKGAPQQKHPSHPSRLVVVSSTKLAEYQVLTDRLLLLLFRGFVGGVVHHMADVVGALGVKPLARHHQVGPRKETCPSG